MKQMSPLKVFLSSFAIPLIFVSLLTSILNTRYVLLKNGEIWKSTFVHNLFGCSPLFHNFQTAISNSHRLAFFGFIGFILSFLIFKRVSRGSTKGLLVLSVLIGLFANVGDLMFLALRTVSGELNATYVPVGVRTVIWATTTYIVSLVIPPLPHSNTKL